MSARASPRALRRRIATTLLNARAHAHAVVTAEGGIVHLSGDLLAVLDPVPEAPGPDIRGPDGLPDLLKAARRGLRPVLSQLLSTAAAEAHSASAEAVLVDRHGTEGRASIRVEPMAAAPSAERLFLVIIDTAVAPGPGRANPSPGVAPDVQQVATLVAELNHRVKNMLACAVGLTEQTFLTAGDAGDTRARLVSRLRGLSAPYELLSRLGWADPPLAELLHLQLEPLGGSRVSSEGPDVWLSPRQALALGMVIHELATNAVQHGALAKAEGRLDVRWDVQAQGTGGRGTEPQIRLDWRESGAGPIALPERRGLGLRLIERQTAYDLLGRSELRFESEGLWATLSFPMIAPTGSSDAA